MGRLLFVAGEARSYSVAFLNGQLGGLFDVEPHGRKARAGSPNFDRADDPRANNSRVESNSGFFVLSINVTPLWVTQWR